jgi:hypothetical protein
VTLEAVGWLATAVFSASYLFRSGADVVGVVPFLLERVWLGRSYALQGAIFEDVGRFSDARSLSS